MMNVAYTVRNKDTLSIVREGVCDIDDFDAQTGGDPDLEVINTPLDVDFIPGVPPEDPSEAPEITLKRAKGRALATVNNRVELARRAYITILDGQGMVYIEKRREAEALMADPEISPSEIPHITKEADLDAVTPTDKAVEILTMAHYWSEASSDIEIMRLGAKEAIEAATTVAEVEAAIANI